MAELGSEESLQHLLNFLRQGEELIEFWLGDFLNEDIWQTIYHCGDRQLHLLKDFIKEPGNYMCARSAAAETVQQIALHQPERKTEVVEWYRDLLEFMLEKVEDENITDAQLNAFLIGDCIPLGAEDLTDLITGLYMADAVDPDIIGDLEDVLNVIPRRRGHDYAKGNLFTDINSRYEDVLNTWSYYTSGDDLDDTGSGVENFNPLLNWDRQEPVIAGSKTRRNDPCPCGSGKKYKKCCME